jgi:putative transcriptional regulator
MTNKVVKQTKIIVTRRRYMTLKNRLKERRAALNVNQQEMGRLCGVTVEDVFYLQEEDEDGEK